MIETRQQFFFFLLLRPPPTPPLFPYTTLFRSVVDAGLEPGPDVTVITDAGPRALRLHVDADLRSEEHTSELQSRVELVCRLLLEKKKTDPQWHMHVDLNALHHQSLQSIILDTT